MTPNPAPWRRRPADWPPATPRSPDDAALDRLPMAETGHLRPRWPVRAHPAEPLPAVWRPGWRRPRIPAPRSSATRRPGAPGWRYSPDMAAVAARGSGSDRG